MKAASLAQRTLVAYLSKRDPSLSETEIKSLLLNIRRFVRVVQKIYTEPQAKIYFKESKVNGKHIRKRIIETTPEELSKLNAGTDNPITVETIREFTKKVTRVRTNKYGKQ